MSRLYSIKRVNNFGKGLGILVFFAKLFLFFALLGSLLMTWFVFVLPDDAINFKLAADVDIEVNGTENIDVSTLEKDDVTSSSEGAKSGENPTKAMREQLTKGILFSLKTYINDYQKNGDITEFKMPQIGYDMSNHTIKRYMLAVTVFILITFIQFIALGRVCRALKKCTTPFSDVVIKRLRGLSIVILPSIFFNYNFFVLPSWKTFLTIDFVALIAFIFIRGIAVILAYGRDTTPVSSILKETNSTKNSYVPETPMTTLATASTTSTTPLNETPETPETIT